MLVAFLVNCPSSEALPAMTAAERSSQHVESKVSATESESDAVEEAYVSELGRDPKYAFTLEAYATP
jgi:hypothetical protein